MCHLGKEFYIEIKQEQCLCFAAKYTMNNDRRSLTDVTEFFASRRLCVDFLHFKVKINKVNKL